MNKNKILQKDYTLSSLYYQIKLPLDLEILIPADDPGPPTEYFCGGNGTQRSL